MYELHKNTCISQEGVNTSIFVSNLHLLLVIIVKCPNNRKKKKQIPTPKLHPVQDSLLIMALAIHYAGKNTQLFLGKACISTMPQGVSWSLLHCAEIISPSWEGEHTMYVPVICNSVAAN